MKTRLLSIIGILVLGLHASPAFAADKDPETYQLVLEQARTKHRPILLDFSGSDWCPPCMQLEKNILSTPEFIQYAQNELVFIEVDFPRQKKLPPSIQKRNEALAAEFNVEAFPTLILISPSGKELARKVGLVEGGPSNLINWINQYKSKQ